MRPQAHWVPLGVPLAVVIPKPWDGSKVFTNLEAHDKEICISFQPLQSK